MPKRNVVYSVGMPSALPVIMAPAPTTHNGQTIDYSPLVLPFPFPLFSIRAFVLPILINSISSWSGCCKNCISSPVSAPKKVRALEVSVTWCSDLTVATLIGISALGSKDTGGVPFIVSILSYYG